MEVVSMNRLDYDKLKFHEQQIEELCILAEQLENGELEEAGFVDAVLHVL